jgi:beta-lactamase superfamily II metal-dependent hydrolase
MFRLTMLNVEQGDCLWLDYGEPLMPRRILIDGGPTGTTALRDCIARALGADPNNQLHFELLIITHVDDDHIAGVLDLLKTLPHGVSFGDVWFNAYKHLVAPDRLGPVQGESLSELIERHALPWNRAFGGLGVVIPDRGSLPRIQFADGMTLTLLSPTIQRLTNLKPVWEKKVIEAGLLPGRRPSAPPEDLLGHRDVWPPDILALAAKPPNDDREEANGSSIAVLAEYGGHSVLLAADAFAPVLEDSIGRLLTERKCERLAVDAFKLLHHGSRRNLRNGLLQLLRCPRYLISTSGKRFAHPDNEAMARVLIHGGAKPLLAFNYASEWSRRWRDDPPRGAPTYTACYPPDGSTGLSIVIPNADPGAGY